ncbi:MAG: NAD-dependent DNA ligase LigA, partial [Rikenellaceae bacterium]
MNIAERIDFLRTKLDELNYKYYVLNESLVSDEEFDKMMKELERLESENPQFFDPNSPSQRVGNDTNQSFTQVAHRYPMLSLSNTYSKEEL